MSILNLLAAALGSLVPQNTMVAATSGTATGYGTNPPNTPSFGTLAPTTSKGGNSVALLCSATGTGFEFWLQSASSLGQSYFTTLTIWGPGIGVVKLSSSAATYAYATYSKWTWASGGPTLSSGNTYYFRLD